MIFVLFSHGREIKRMLKVFTNVFVLFKAHRDLVSQMLCEHAHYFNEHIKRIEDDPGSVVKLILLHQNRIIIDAGVGNSAVTLGPPVRLVIRDEMRIWPLWSTRVCLH